MPISLNPEHFSAWAESHFPWIVAIADESNRKVFFHDKSLQMAWMAFQHAFTVRPTTDTRLNSAEFMKDDPATIVDRLNGVFPTADPPYKMSPLHYEAAREIERLRVDAERYRFLRFENALCAGEGYGFIVSQELRESADDEDDVWVGTDLDSAIDSVIGSKKPAEAG